MRSSDVVDAIVRQIDCFPTNNACVVENRSGVGSVAAARKRQEASGKEAVASSQRKAFALCACRTAFMPRYLRVFF